jgi:small subunit ribosomal protein S19
MRRSLKKGPFVAQHLLFQLETLIKRNEKKTIITHARSSTIVPIIIGYTIAVHNGREHMPILITDQIIGHKLGEFSFTRIACSHVKQSKKVKRLKSLLWDKKHTPLVYDSVLISGRDRNGMQKIVTIIFLLEKIITFENIFIETINIAIFLKS